MIRVGTVVLLFGSALLAFAAEPPKASFSASTRTDQAVTAAPPGTASRPFSATTKARLNAGLPSFTSEIKAETEPVEATAADLETEGSTNDIIRLPQYDVQDAKLPKFRSRELLTPNGRADVALRRHPGLRFGPLSVLNVRRGVEMLEEEDAIDRRQEMFDLVSFASSIERNLPQNPATGLRTMRADLRAK